jgi:hypothetical protein
MNVFICGDSFFVEFFDFMEVSVFFFVLNNYGTIKKVVYSFSDN